MTEPLRIASAIFAAIAASVLLALAPPPQERPAVA